MPLKPQALHRGDTVGIAAPGSAVPREAFEAGVRRLEGAGYRVKYRPDVLSREEYSGGAFAGSAERRAAEWIEMLEDPEIRAVFCARGGYGCNYLIPFLTGHPMPAPKIIVGYSDVTTLHSFLWKANNWVTFHGPMVSIDFSRNAGVLGPALESTSGWEAARDLTTLAEGSAEGTLLGGCLSIALTTLGTPREIDWHDAIVFLEDIGEAPYRIDRMLFQLREAGKFDSVRGVVFGEMKDCGTPDLLRHLKDLSIPVAAGLPSGHTSGKNICLPLGVQARLAGGALTILEGAVV